MKSEKKDYPGLLVFLTSREFPLALSCQIQHQRPLAKIYNSLMDWTQYFNEK